MHAAVGRMAGQACHIVPRPRVLDASAEGMAELRMILVAAPTRLGDARPAQQRFVVGDMADMAGVAATALRLQGMDRHRVVDGLLDLAMAREADVAAASLHESRLVGCVRGVAGDAALLHAL